LSELSQHYDELQAKGIEILALSVEGLGGDASATANAARLVSKSMFPFPVGLATPQLTADFQHLHNRQTPLHRQLPLPSSFLIDRQGRLAVIYKGPVSIDELLEDVAHSEGSRLERFARSAPIAGQPIRHPQVERTAVKSSVFLRFLLAQYLQHSGRADQAARQYADVLEFRPDSFRAHNNLGNALQRQGKIVEAIEHYHRALRIKPDYAEAHYNLGTALSVQGDIPAAVRHYTRALDLNPDFPQALNNLAWIRATHPDAVFRDGTKAVKLAERSCELTGHQVVSELDTLAAAYAEAGRFGEAIKAALQAIDAETAEGNEKLAQKIHVRVVLYRQGVPYREASE